jgi:hypothetical protein
MLRRWTLVSNITWPSAISTGTILATYNVVADLLTNEIIGTPFQRFVYWRAKKISVRVQVAASRFFQGRLLVCYRPTMRLYVPTMQPDKTQMVQLQHVFLDPANGTSGELDIPFIFNAGYLNLTAGDTLGQIHVVVYNPYVGITGSPAAITAKMWVSIDGSEFKIPVAGGLTFAQVRNQSYDYIEAQSGLIAMAGAALAPIIKKSLPKNLIGDTIGGLLDKPQITLQPQILVRKDQQFLSNVTGPEFVEKLTLDSSAQQMVDHEHFATEQDEMSIPYLLSKINYVGTVPWSVSDATNTRVFTTRVGPNVNPTTLTTTLSTIDFIANNFVYWRGGLKFTFEVVGTQFHEGAIDIVFNPATDTTPSNYSAAVSQYVSTFIVRNGENRFEVVVPFLSDTPFKKVYSGGLLSTTISSTAQSYLDFFTGTLTAIVSIPLKAPTTVSPSVAINIFVSAADDFEFAVPSFQGNNLIVNPV